MLKMVPATSHNGWQLMNLQKGLRVWQQLTEKFSRDVAVISGTLCLDCKPKVQLKQINAVCSLFPQEKND